MKFVCFVVAAGICFAVGEACKIHEWRGHSIMCCKNGTALLQRGKEIWVAEKPVLCALTKEQNHSNSAFAKLCGGIMFLAVCCLLYYCFKKRRQIQQCVIRCYVNRQNEDQQAKVDTDEKEVAIEMRARRFSV